MQRLELRRRPVDVAKLAVATDAHYTQVHADSAVFTENGQVRIVFDDAPFDDEALRAACKGINYPSNDRTSGMVSRSRIFGNQPRNVLRRRDYCAAAAMAYDHPAAHGALVRAAQRVTDVFANWHPEGAASQRALVRQQVLPEWRLPGETFTSGIVNWDNPLRYHHDGGNFPGAWSAMIVLTRGIEGGRLVMPEYGIAFDFAIGGTKVILFDGQGILHGVTKIRKVRADGYRYSIVWYALKGMCKCLSARAELARARAAATGREQKRLRPQDKDKAAE
jgi:hypothetical protein